MESTKKKRYEQKTSGRSKYDFSSPYPITRISTITKTIAEITGYSRPEVRLVYDAIMAVIHYELAHERPVQLPGVGKLIPQVLVNVRRHDITTGGYNVSPTWVSTRFLADKELVAAYRKNHPFFPMDEKTGEPIYPDA